MTRMCPIDFFFSLAPSTNIDYINFIGVEAKLFATLLHLIDSVNMQPEGNKVFIIGTRTGLTLHCPADECSLILITSHFDMASFDKPTPCSGHFASPLRSTGQNIRPSSERSGTAATCPGNHHQRQVNQCQIRHPRSADCFHLVYVY